MTLDERMTALIAVGASVAANCGPCLDHHAGKARAAGAGADEIAQAIEVGKGARAGAAMMMDRHAAKLPGASSLAMAASPAGCCRC